MHYHLKKHTGEASYACTVCDKKFIQKSGLTQHMAQIHTTNAPTWSCPFAECDHVAKSKANILIHVGRVHGDCGDCGGCGDNSKDAWIPRYKDNCVQCGKVFNSAGAYYYHAVSCFATVAPVATQHTAITEALVKLGILTA